jgi:hypothetical protein
VTDHDRLPIFVYVVESPSAADIYHGRSEGGLVAQALALDGVPCVTRTTINQHAFTAALTIGLPEAMATFPGRIPVLHLSAHGSSQGIELSSTAFVPWDGLRSLVTPINRQLSGCLVLCMSACDGYSACQMAMRADDSEHPYFALVANYGKPTWSETGVGYAAFYHRLGHGSGIAEAVAAMIAASGNDRWTFETAETTKRSYLDFIARDVNVLVAQQNLEEDARRQDLPSDVKALENQ